MKLLDYDKKTLLEIHAWKNPQRGWLDKAIDVVNKPLNAAGEAVLSTPVVGDAIQKAAEGLISVCNDAAQWSVRSEAVFEEFRSDGHNHIEQHSDIKTLRLEDIDKTVGWLAAKYKGIALAEGAGAGVAGIAGLAVDIPTLITLNLRAIGEYATYYGFDIAKQEERLFAYNILAFSSSPTDMSKNLAMAQLIKISQQVAKNQAWKQLEQHTFVQIIRQIASTLGIRLTKAKLAQAIPMTGAIVGGGFNAYFTSKVCEAAYYLYRERFLAELYGASIIEETVKPAKTYEPDYPDAFEGELME
ncbi:hypothetical protein A9B99_18615 [Mangrovibacter phragmitis]|uniref:EcsC family protein n=1 Tax=Mangrovibacter phragmitis TaxID=1691903 RepID=A0A1B7L708_9ENTR|nr:EcsC family protein [Mangrovibacter phragmitis]OAT78152.1 hypothetical protein A9B99_18615 [Mangrovibacter phragmitis]